MMKLQEWAVFSQKEAGKDEEAEAKMDSELSDSKTMPQKGYRWLAIILSVIDWGNRFTWCMIGDQLSFQQTDDS